MLKPGDTFFTETKWMQRDRRARLNEYDHPLASRFVNEGQPQFVYFRPGLQRYFQKGQKRYFCQVLRLAGYATRSVYPIREFKFTYEVKIIE